MKFGKQRQELIKSNSKEHYKMYKAGRRWFFAGIATFSGLLGGAAASSQANAKADSTVQTVTQTTNKGDVLATKDSATIPSGSTSTSTSTSTNSTSTSTSTSSSTTTSTSTSQTSTSTSTSNNSTSSSLSTSISTSLSTSETSTKTDTTSAASDTTTQATNSEAGTISSISTDTATAGTATTNVATAIGLTDATATLDGSGNLTITVGNGVTLTQAEYAAIADYINSNNVLALTISSDIATLKYSHGTTEVTANNDDDSDAAITAGKELADAIYDATGAAQAVTISASSSYAGEYATPSASPIYFVGIPVTTGFITQPQSQNVVSGNTVTIS
ncbi:KxYKxGKxW signal peptide domain-containing protein [Paucilactobacillus suebicus]|uniref:Levansucrase n=1 Tax=Paucilactobacillus suebicus DSM 5007 = KCTC 3549 TaxID=1423807 RepID=A0A0R1W1M8_9LACO|nr:KxYKxGKxW signal peptide domain-containing protein [Paucilactobacillus suebicus]KRM11623.1 Levansucrase [Paucilactobacillus suebicus DSM 5007 = KCTC 3549]